MAGLEQPFWKEIEASQTVLLAGCGGGYDVFCGLPLYFALREMGKTVYLANYSFSSIYASNGQRHGEACVEISADTEGSEVYFPERYLAGWFRSMGEEVSIYAFDRTGVMPLTGAYRRLKEMLNLDTIILVDGGTDSLMRGDEAGLGTPHEDVTSIAAVHQLDIANKLLVCLGFGVDTYHGVCHAQFLEAVANVTKAGGFLGAWALTRDMPEAQRYKEASDYVFQQMQTYPSIVSSSILSAIDGEFGDFHATSRTEGSELFINPLMALYWCFQLAPVAQRIMYLSEISWTRTYAEVGATIGAFRAHLKNKKPWQNLPM